MKWNYVGEDTSGKDDEDFVVSVDGIISEGERENSIISEHETNDIATGRELLIGEKPYIDETHYIPNYTEGDYQVEWLYAPKTKPDTPVTVKIK